MLIWELGDKMKKNNKGYMLVEIIVSFVLAFSIAMYLMNLAVRFKDTNEEIYYSARYSKDKNLIIRNIMEDLTKGIISNVNVTTNNVTFTLSLKDDAGNIVNETRKLILSDKKIQYGKYDSNFVTSDKSYYEKNLEPSLIVKDIENCSDLSGGYFCVKIPITSMYDNYNYDIKLFSSNV